MPWLSYSKFSGKMMISPFESCGAATLERLETRSLLQSVEIWLEGFNCSTQKVHVIDQILGR